MHICVFCMFGADLLAQLALINKISAAELSGKFIKSASLVGPVPYSTRSTVYVLRLFPPKLERPFLSLPSFLPPSLLSRPECQPTRKGYFFPHMDGWTDGLLQPFSGSHTFYSSFPPYASSSSSCSSPKNTQMQQALRAPYGGGGGGGGALPGWLSIQPSNRSHREGERRKTSLNTSIWWILLGEYCFPSIIGIQSN